MITALGYKEAVFVKSRAQSGNEMKQLENTIFHVPAAWNITELCKQTRLDHPGPTDNPAYQGVFKERAPWKVPLGGFICTRCCHEVVNEAQEAQSFLNGNVATSAAFTRFSEPRSRVCSTGVCRLLAQATELAQQLGKLSLGISTLLALGLLVLCSDCHIQQATDEVPHNNHNIPDVQLVSNSVEGWSQVGAVNA